MWLEGLVYILSALSAFVLAAFIAVGKLTRIRMIYLSLLVLVFLYILSQFLVITTSGDLALTILRTGALAVNFMAYSVLLFCLVYTGHAISVARGIILLLPLCFFALFGYSPLLIEEVSRGSGGFTTTTGSLYTLQTIVVVAYFIVALVILASGLKGAKGSYRSNLKILLVGFALPVAINFMTNYVFIDNPSAQILVPVSLLILSGSAAYAIVRHDLFDIRLVVARLLAYATALSFLAAIFGLVVFGAATILFNVRVPLTAMIFISVSTAFAAITFARVKAFFDRLSDRIFYQDAYDAQAFIAELNRIVVMTVALGNLLEKVVETFMRFMKSDRAAVYLYRSGRSEERLVGNLHVGKNGRELVDVLPKLFEVSTDKIVVTDQLEDGVVGYDVLRKYDVGVVAALISSGSAHELPIGYLILAPKKSGGPYSNRDIRVINIIADELVVAIQNAQRFEEIQNFNVTLQERVDEATRRLRKTNERLRLLDQTKDDFISMASHQLRTPLTSVKGYVSMVLDGDAGPINATQRKLLMQSFLSAQRMVYLISDLLNVSRLKTGKFVIEPVESKLDKVIEEELEQLTETVKSRGLTLKYHKPEHFPTLMLDETKIRQVIMNFVDNAIYYTPSGGHIDVYLEDKGESVEFRVVDDGIGVPKHEQHHLFTKFYRAKNAKNARPDGTGLGIFMAKKVIIAQGGAVIFKSTENKGSTFGFTFPKAKLLPPLKPESKQPASKEAQPA